MNIFFHGKNNIGPIHNHASVCLHKTKNFAELNSSKIIPHPSIHPSIIHWISQLLLVCSSTHFNVIIIIIIIKQSFFKYNFSIVKYAAATVDILSGNLVSIWIEPKEYNWQREQTNMDMGHSRCNLTYSYKQYICQSNKQTIANNNNNNDKIQEAMKKMGQKRKLKNDALAQHLIILHHHRCHRHHHITLFLQLQIIIKWH